MIEVDTREWPEKAIRARWAKVLGVSLQTMFYKQRDGILVGRKLINGRVVFTKEEIMRAFKIRHVNGD